MAFAVMSCVADSSTHTLKLVPESPYRDQGHYSAPSQLAVVTISVTMSVNVAFSSIETLPGAAVRSTALIEIGE